MNIYSIANDVNGTVNDFNKLVQYCREYMKLSSRHSNKYIGSVKNMLQFINSTADTSGGVIKPQKLQFEYLGFSINESMMGTHQEVRAVEVPDGWSKRTEYRQFTVLNDPEARIIVEINEKVVFESSIVKSKECTVSEVFTISWLPREEIKVKVQNFTGKTVELKISGFLAINLLLGDVNFNNEVIVRFSGGKMVIPPLAKP